ncbi:su(Hw) family protein [Megaselia abdita]
MKQERRQTRNTMTGCDVLNIKMTDDNISLMMMDNTQNQNQEHVTSYVLDIKGEGNNDSEIVVNPKDGPKVIEMEAADEETYDPSGREIIEHICGKCNVSFPSIQTLRKHVPYCRYTADSHIRMAEMAKHLDKIEKESESMHKQNICFCCEEDYDTCHSGHINCHHCTKAFRSQSSLERHIFLSHTLHDQFPCTICNAKCPTKTIQDLHIREHTLRNKPFGCKKCGKEFTRAYHVSRHQKYSSCGEGQNTVLKCDVCSKSFYRLDNLRVHLKQHINKDQNVKTDFQCPYCERYFTSSSILNIHIRTHTGEKPFPCDLCEKSFPSNVALKKHRRYHTGERPYKCSECPLAFAAKEVLNRHMKRHTGEKPHKCSLCDKGFIQASQLRTHMNTHNKVKFDCDICGDSYKTNKGLETHLKNKHSENRSESKKLVCSVCKKSYVNKIALQRHMTSSHKIINKECEFCTDFVAKSQEEFDFHVLKYHSQPQTSTSAKNAINELILETVEEIEEAVEDDDHLIVECDLCEEIFVNEESKEEHLRDFHKVNKRKKNAAQQPSVSPQNIRKSKRTCTRTSGQLELSPPANFAKKEENAGDRVFEYVIEEIQQDGVTRTTTQLEPVAGQSSGIVLSLNNSGGNLISIPLGDQNQEAAEDDEYSMDSVSLAKSVRELLDLLVDSNTLKKFGWPSSPVEYVLEKVIENCGQSLTDLQLGSNDYDTRMREYVKVLFSVVIDNESIRELLNNHPIDEVIYQVLAMAQED